MELVRLALEKEGSVAALARQHDVNDNLLFKWIRLWQREGRVCYPRKNSLSLPVLIPVQLRAEPSSPTSEPLSGFSSSRWPQAFLVWRCCLFTRCGACCPACPGLTTR
ncbi:transposase [Salmonella enterica]